MSCKQLVTETAFAVLLVLLLNISFATAASSESVQKASEGEGKSYFGYQPQSHDSYKKLVQDISDEETWADWLQLYAKIEALHKKLYYRKDKDYGGYDYSKLQRMQQLLSEQKATIDALRSDRLNVPTV